MLAKKNPPTGGKNNILSWLIFVVLLCFAAGCAKTHIPNEKYVQTAVIFGTVARLSAEGDEAEAAVRECLERLDVLNRLFDADSPDGPLARLVSNAGSGTWVSLPPDLWHVLFVSQRYSELTDGAWDITVAPLASLWKKSIADGIIPSEDELAAARNKVDWKKLELREAEQSARLTEPYMSLDLGGVRKGFALDKCRRIYAKHHVSGLIDLGESSIAAVGGKKNGEPLRVALRHPRENPPAHLGVMNLKNAVISSSGDYEHFFLANGVRYHHILDPRTGRPASSDVSSVFIRADADEPDAGLISDVLSTALFVAGTENGLAILPNLPIRVEAAFVNETEIFAQTGGFSTGFKE